MVDSGIRISFFFFLCQKKENDSALHYTQVLLQGYLSSSKSRWGILQSTLASLDPVYGKKVTIPKINEQLYILFKKTNDLCKMYWSFLSHHNLPSPYSGNEFSNWNLVVNFFFFYQIYLIISHIVRWLSVLITYCSIVSYLGFSGLNNIFIFSWFLCVKTLRAV